jgi:hypothetical protein
MTNFHSGSCGIEGQLLASCLDGLEHLYLVEKDSTLMVEGVDRIQKRYGKKTEVKA